MQTVPWRLAAVSVLRPATFRMMSSATTSAFFGGEYAGWQVDFDADSGAVCREALERQCSEEMIQWGQVPDGFELLSTEKCCARTIERRFLRIYPEQGCAIDNLPAEVSTSTLHADDIDSDNPIRVVAIDDAPDANDPSRANHYLRTIFASHSGGSRCRVSLRFDPQQRRLSAKGIRVALERRWAAGAGALAAEQGSAAASAVGVCRSGLDASFVTKAIGFCCFTGARGVPLLALPEGATHAAVAEEEELHRVALPGICVRIVALEGGRCAVDVCASSSLEAFVEDVASHADHARRGRGRRTVRREFASDGRLLRRAYLFEDE